MLLDAPQADTGANFSSCGSFVSFFFPRKAASVGWRVKGRLLPFPSAQHEIIGSDSACGLATSFQPRAFSCHGYHISSQVCSAPSRTEDLFSTDSTFTCVLQVVNLTNAGFTVGFTRPQYNKHCRCLTRIPAEGTHRLHQCNNVENVQYIDMAPLRSDVPATMNDLI